MYIIYFNKLTFNLLSLYYLHYILLVCSIILLLLLVLQYKTFHCSPYLDNVFDESCWEITNNLRKEYYSLIFSIYGNVNKNENKSIIIEEHKRKKIELNEKEIEEIEESADDERINSIYILVENQNNTKDDKDPKKRKLKYYTNKYTKEDILIHLKSAPSSEREKFSLYKKIFYSNNPKMNNIKKIFIPVATSLRFFIIESYKMDPSNALTEREFSALLASIVSSMSYLLGVHHTQNNNSSLKIIHKARPLPKNKVTKMSLNVIHRFSQFQNIVFMNIYILSILSLLDSSFLVSKNSIIYNFHEYCWALGFHKFLEYFKTIEYMKNDRGNPAGPFHSSYLNSEFRSLFNAITENLKEYIVYDNNKSFLKSYYNTK